MCGNCEAMAMQISQSLGRGKTHMPQEVEEKVIGPAHEISIMRSVYLVTSPSKLLVVWCLRFWGFKGLPRYLI